MQRDMSHMYGVCGHSTLHGRGLDSAVCPRGWIPEQAGVEQIALPRRLFQTLYSVLRSMIVLNNRNEVHLESETTDESRGTDGAKME